mmetsp:Transcript_30596/g.81186  ORF Transcript_30596/g.81186 Transcript_30596/m.81186 type:complete len:242 (+) Transcript_30596:2011-2736(+)
MSGRKSRMVLGTAWMLIIACSFARPAALGVSLHSRLTLHVAGPRKCTARTRLRRQFSRKVPRTLSSASGLGYSGSSSSVRERQTIAGVRSSIGSSSTSTEYGCRTPATCESKLSLPQRTSSLARSWLALSSQTTLPRRPLPRYPSSTSSGSRDSLPSSPISLSFSSVFSMSPSPLQTRSTQKPFSSMQVAISCPRPSASVRGAMSMSKLLSSPPSPGFFASTLARTLALSKWAASPLASCT